MRRRRKSSVAVRRPGPSVVQVQPVGRVEMARQGLAPAGQEPLQDVITTSPGSTPSPGFLVLARLVHPAEVEHGKALAPEKHGLRFHDLRHTCAALLIDAGAHPKGAAPAREGCCA